MSVIFDLERNAIMLELDSAVIFVGLLCFDLGKPEPWKALFFFEFFSWVVVRSIAKSSLKKLVFFVFLTHYDNHLCGLGMFCISYVEF